MAVTDPYTRREALAALAGTGTALLAGCPGTQVAPTIDVDDARRDEQTPLAVTGFPENSEVTVRSRTEWRDTTWGSTATFETGAGGFVETREQAPIDGTYDEADGMGWLWSMEAGRDPVTTTTTVAESGDADGTSDPPSGGDPGSPYPQEMTVSIQTVVDGETEAQTTVRRQLVAEGVTHLRVREEDLAGEAFLPGSEGPHPSVLVCHGAGGDAWVAAARLLASHGYAAFAVDYFGSAAGNPSSHSEVPLAYFRRARDWLAARSGTERAGVVGKSRGGELTLLLGATFDWVDAMVAYVPSSHVWGFGDSGWARDGDALPYLTASVSDAEQTEDGLAVLTPMFEAALESASASEQEAAAIPVEQASAPLLLISGRADRVWPSTRFARRVTRRLDDAGYAYKYEHLAYDDAGHAVSTVPYVPTTGLTASPDWAYGGTPRGIADAIADHWPRALEYLERGLSETTENG